MRLEEEVPVRRNTVRDTTLDEESEGEGEGEGDNQEGGGRRMFVTAVGSRLSIVPDQKLHVPTQQPLGTFRMSYVAGAVDYIPPAPTKPQQALSRQQGVQAVDFATDPAPRISPKRHGVILSPSSSSRTTRQRKTSWAQSPV